MFAMSRVNRTRPALRYAFEHCRCVQGLIVTADRVVDSDADDTQDLEKLKEMLSMLAQKYSTADIAELGFDKATANNAGAYSR